MIENVGALLPEGPVLKVNFSLSTAWNASRHRSGEQMIAEIAACGFNRVELGYGLTLDLVSGVRKAVESANVTVGSVHAVCPVPAGVPWSAGGGFKLCDSETARRETAVRLLADTIRFAGDIGAGLVVAHAGDVDMRHGTEDLVEMFIHGQQGHPRFENSRVSLMMDREKRARPAIERLMRSLDVILPVLDASGVRMGIEILPYWESVPTEMETLDLLRHYNHPLLGYWHDIGHAQVRQNLGFIGVRLWLDRLKPWLLGMHIHDVVPPAFDHLMPPRGKVRFEDYRVVAQSCELVIEPNNSVSTDDIRNAREFLEKTWSAGGQATGV